jgi:hypothetical protein
MMIYIPDRRIKKNYSDNRGDGIFNDSTLYSQTNIPASEELFISESMDTFDEQYRRFNLNFYKMCAECVIVRETAKENLTTIFLRYADVKSFYMELGAAVKTITDVDNILERYGILTVSPVFPITTLGESHGIDILQCYTDPNNNTFYADSYEHVFAIPPFDETSVTFYDTGYAAVLGVGDEASPAYDWFTLYDTGGLVEPILALNCREAVSIYTEAFTLPLHCHLAQPNFDASHNKSIYSNNRVIRGNNFMITN